MQHKKGNQDENTIITQDIEAEQVYQKKKNRKIFCCFFCLQIEKSVFSETKIITHLTQHTNFGK